MSENLSYQQAFDELQGLARQIEANEVPIDQLPSTLQRASQLLDRCRQLLQSTEEELAKLKGE